MIGVVNFNTTTYSTSSIDALRLKGTMAGRVATVYLLCCDCFSSKSPANLQDPGEEDGAARYSSLSRPVQMFRFRRMRYPAPRAKESQHSALIKGVDLVTPILLNALTVPAYLKMFSSGQVTCNIAWTTRFPP